MDSNAFDKDVSSSRICLRKREALAVFVDKGNNNTKHNLLIINRHSECLRCDANYEIEMLNRPL